MIPVRVSPPRAPAPPRVRCWGWESDGAVAPVGQRSGADLRSPTSHRVDRAARPV